VCDYVCYPISTLHRIWGLQEFESPRFSTQLAHEVGKDVSPTHSRLYPQMTSLALICVRCCVDARATVRPQRIFLKRHRDSKSLTFDLKFSASTNCATVRPIDITCMRPLDDNKEINVNPSLSSIRYQHIKPVYVRFTNKYLSASAQVRPDRLWDAVLCVKVVLRWNLGGKCCKVSWFITVTHCSLCTLMFVLFADSVNSRVVPALGKRHE